MCVPGDTHTIPKAVPSLGGKEVSTHLLVNVVYKAERGDGWDPALSPTASLTRDVGPGGCAPRVAQCPMAWIPVLHDGSAVLRGVATADHRPAHSSQVPQRLLGRQALRLTEGKG